MHMLEGPINLATALVTFTGTLINMASPIIQFVRERGKDKKHKKLPKPIDNIGEIKVDALYKILKKSTIKKGPQLVTVRGIFYPCLLLATPWWQRKKNNPRPEFKTGLQSWLYRGFEEWAPSWDISFKIKNKTPFILGQIGTGDEANSIAVIIPRSKIDNVSDLLQRNIVFEGVIKGVLYHRSQLPEVYTEGLRNWSKVFDYCIVMEDNKRDSILRAGSVSEGYSGYIWQCLGPRPNRGTVPLVNEVYFIWEHTDFSKPDALKYNLDALNFKAEYIRKQHKDFALLQKSASIVPGDPVIETDKFYKHILGQA